MSSKYKVEIDCPAMYVNEITGDERIVMVYAKIADGCEWRSALYVCLDCSTDEYFIAAEYQLENPL